MATSNNFVDNIKKLPLQWEKELGLEKIEFLQTASAKTGQPPIYIFMAAVGLTFLIIVQLFGLAFVSNLCGFVPIYASFKALQTHEKDDDVYWLTYWYVL